MDENSFDPRSWNKPKQATDAGSPPAKADAPAGDSAEKTSLPEAWEAVVTNFRPGSQAAPPPAAAPAPAEADDAGRKRRWLAPLLIAACVLLAGGGVGMWMLRVPSAPPPEAPQAETAGALMAKPEPSAVERAINLTGVGELAAVLTASGVAPADAAVAAKAAASVLTAPGELRARIVLAPQGDGFRLERIQASYADGSGVVVTRESDGGFVPHKVAADLTRQVKVLRGELDSESFYTSAVTAGLIDTLIPEFINAFGYDFNLASEVAPGDTFEVAYEQSVNDSGEPVGQPQLLFASLTTQQKSLALYRYKQADGTVGWFDGNGALTQRGFMRTPIDGARITSKFGLRFHPVLHYTRLHGGVDFGAPIGTPIYAAADGTVVSASPSACAGNMVIIRHENGYETRYFHLSRYADGLHAGQQVTQGYVIGLVGTTGTCTTGPHLHYEVHINGEKIDPLTVKTDDAKRKRLDSAALAGFMQERDRIDVARAKQAF